MGRSGKGGGTMRGMPVGKRMVREELVGELVAWGEEMRRREPVEPVETVEGQWWCGACRELRTRSELEGFERAGQMIYACLACGELVETLPF